MFNGLKKKKQFFLLIFIFVFLFFFCFLFLQKEFFLIKPGFSFADSLENKVEKKDCKIKKEERIVRGSSLSPVLEPGQKIEVNFGYYDCYEVKRNDVVVLKNASNPELLIKIVKGLPGDNFHLEKNQSGWNILINGEILKNSEGWPYFLNEQKQKMLALYERDYQGKIPSESFLVLGNITSGTLDSSFFGLVPKADILGKVNF
jgi:signal peptidase I